MCYGTFHFGTIVLSGLAQELQQMTAQFKIGEEDPATRSERKRTAAGGNGHDGNGHGGGGRSDEGGEAKLQLVSVGSNEKDKGPG